MIASKKSSRKRSKYRRSYTPRPPRRHNRNPQNREESLMRITLIQSVITVVVIGFTVVLNGLGFMSRDLCNDIQAVINNNYSPSVMVNGVLESLSFDGEGYGSELLSKVINLYRTPVHVTGNNITNLPPIDPPVANSRGSIDDVIESPVIDEDDTTITGETEGELIEVEDLPESGTAMEVEGTGGIATIHPSYVSSSVLGGYTSIPDLTVSIPDDIVKNGVITCDFGFRTHPISGNQDFHTGVDIGATKGTDITVPFDGKVVHIGVSTAYGNYLEIQHSDGVLSYYSHCDKILVREGQKVKKGDVIARVGNTGVSTGPHLHFELMLEGSYIDPMKATAQRKEL